MASPGDGRRDCQPRVQPWIPSSAQRATRRVLGRGAGRPYVLLGCLWRRDLGGAHPQRQRTARGDGPSGDLQFRPGPRRRRLAADERLRQVLHDYFAWATTTTMARYHDSADDVPEGLSISRWSWDGLQH